MSNRVIFERRYSRYGILTFNCGRYNRITHWIQGNQQNHHSNIKDYDETIVGETLKFLNPSLEQPGDPAKGAKRIVELMRGEWPGSETGKRIPERLALGEDAYGSVNEFYAARLKENEEWREWSCGVNFEDASGVTSGNRVKDFITSFC